ncbi:MAG: 2-hydroxymuconate tautomerase [Pseudochelatococcus sp.]|jgi:4-oxalocrotonate tautomerase|uniref:2-hydroxymuconate tautomerase n=1 Tax=Pseudochelatococcus sp. TaxID=2020869 RepID=UPI003D8FA863
MPLAEITLIEGRSPEQKKALFREVTEAIVRAVGAPPDTVRIVIREVPAEHWAIAGISYAERQAKKPGGS